MARESAAAGAHADTGLDTVLGQILWQEMRLLGYVTIHTKHLPLLSSNVTSGWAKFMEWKYPVSIEITSPGAFKGAGAIEAAASL